MAAAVTPTLYIKTDTPLKFDHIEASSPEEAYEAIKEGQTVVVKNSFTAFNTLRLLGMSGEDAAVRIKIAKVGPAAVGAVDPNHPVPRAPSEDGPGQGPQQHGDALRG
jgi:hypothetical protein